MGAGCSGAGAPFTVSSIQLTLVPSLYVWIALNSSELVFDGSCPAEIVNRSNWFGGMPPAVAVQVIFETASEIVPSSVVTGFGSFAVVTVASQPAFVCANADNNGVLVGKSTSSPVTFEPFVASFGVEKLKITSDAPFGNDGGCTVTWAHAAPAPNATATTTPSAVAATAGIR